MKKTNVYQLTVCALMAAIMCIFGPLSVPIGPVPVSLTNLVLYFTIFLLGTRDTVISYLVYLLLGLFGLPVFSGYSGGVAKLAGPTGGYLIGFIFMVIIGGVIMEKTNAHTVFTILGMILATAVAYAFGTAWFMLEAKAAFSYAMSVCVLPFIPFDLVKIILATLLGKQVRKALTKAGLINVTK